MELSNYNCPTCNALQQASTPTKALVDDRGFWDGFTNCTACKDLLFRRVYPDGRVEAFNEADALKAEPGYNAAGELVEVSIVSEKSTTRHA